MSSPIVLAWMQVIFSLVAGLGIYLFARQTLQVGFWPATIAAWCYPLTGFFVLWQGFGLPLTVGWLPWLLWAVDAAVRGASRWAGPAVAIFTWLVLVSRTA